MMKSFQGWKRDPFKRYYCIPILPRVDTSRPAYQPVPELIHAATNREAVIEFKKRFPEHRSRKVLTISHDAYIAWPRPILHPDPRRPPTQLPLCGGSYND